MMIAERRPAYRLSFTEIREKLNCGKSSKSGNTQCVKENISIDNVDLEILYLVVVFRSSITLLTPQHCTAHKFFNI